MKKNLLYLTALFAILVSSCSTYNTSLPYFEDIKNAQSGEFAQCSYAIKIVPDD